MKRKGSCRIMCLGESTTAGQYPIQLREVLNSRSPEIRFDVIDKGVPAVTTSYILDHLDENLERYRPDIVVVMMGINDGDELAPAVNALITKKRRFSFRILKIVNLIRVWFARSLARYPSSANTKAEVQPAAALESTETGAASPGSRALERGIEYHYHRKYAESETELKKAIALDPELDDAYANLIWLYTDIDKRDDVRAVFEEAMRINPDSLWAYYWMGVAYRRWEEYDQAEIMFRKAIKSFPQEDLLYIELYTIYMMNDRLHDARGILNEAIRASVDTGRIQEAVRFVYKNNGKDRFASHLAGPLRARQMKEITITNYKKLWHTIKNKGMRMVCVQYPMRDVEPVKDIFKGETGIIYVDNGEVFQKAVLEEGPQVYFIDMFGGNFGHCTPKGNMLLAENIADSILSELFIN